MLEDAINKGLLKETSFLKNFHGSGERTGCPRRLSFSSFVILMSTTNDEKDGLLLQTVLSPEPWQFYKKKINNPFDQFVQYFGVLASRRLKIVHSCIPTIDDERCL